MSKYKFELNKRQIKDMEDKNWTVVPKGAWLNIFPEDFGNNSAWSEICQQLDVDPYCDEIKICYIGVIEN